MSLRWQSVSRLRSLIRRRHEKHNPTPRRVFKHAFVANCSTHFHHLVFHLWPDLHCFDIRGPRPAREHPGFVRKPRHNNLGHSWPGPNSDAKRPYGALSARQRPHHARMRRYMSTRQTAAILVAVIIWAVGAEAQPAITAVVNGASFQTGVPRGCIVSIFGTSLAQSTTSASSLPLPKKLGECPLDRRN